MGPDNVRAPNEIPLIRWLLPRPPAGVPPAIWNCVGWIRWVLIFGLVFISALVFFLNGLTGRYGGLLGAALSLLCGYLAKRSQRRFFQNLRLHDYLNCLNCGYCIKGLPSKYECPECGLEYEQERVRRTWMHCVQDER